MPALPTPLRAAPLRRPAPTTGFSFPLGPDISPQRIDLRRRQHIALGGHAVVPAMLDGVHKALFGVRREFAQIGDDVAGIDHAKPVAMRAMLRIKRFAALRLL